MLIIRRRAGESVLIGEEVEIQVVEVNGNRVKLGIVAPPDVLIFRKELKIAEQQNLAAARGVNRDVVADLISRLRS